MADPGKGGSKVQRKPEEIIRKLYLAGVIALAFLMSFHTLAGVDIFWHMKAGEIIWNSGQAPSADVFSFTRAGAEWIDAQWLFQVVVYLLYRVSGYSGMIIFSACLAALTWALILLVGYNRKRQLLLTLIVLVSLLAAGSRMKLRPESFSFLYIALEIFLLVEHRRGRKLCVYFIPPLVLLWVNSEGLWPIGLVILAAFLLEEVFFLPVLKLKEKLEPLFGEPPQGSLMRLCACFLISCLLSLINPYGLKGVLFPWRLFRQISSPASFIGGFIGEFQDPFQHMPWLDLSAYIALIVISGLSLLLLVSYRKISPAALILWLVFLYLSITSLRNVALFAVAAASLTSGALSRDHGIEIPRLKGIKGLLLRARLPAAIGLMIIMALLAFDIITSSFYLRNKSYARFGFGALETEFPVRASRFLKDIPFPPEPLRTGRIFNDLDSAGYLIWSGYPEWKLYTDPRLEVYGEEFMENYASLFTSLSAFQKEDKKYGFDAVVLSPRQKNKLFVRDLYLDQDWALVYADGLNVVFLKNNSFNSEAIRKHMINPSKGLASPLPEGLKGPWLAQERFGRGSMLLVLGQPEQALGELEEALELDPLDPNIAFYTGWALKNLRRYEEAKPYLERTAKRHPDFIPNRLQLAEVYAHMGEIDLSIREFQEILWKSPEEIIACINLAKVFEKARPEKAPDQWKKCDDIYQKNPQRFSSFEPEISLALKRLSGRE